MGKYENYWKYFPFNWQLHCFVVSELIIRLFVIINRRRNLSGSNQVLINGPKSGIAQIIHLIRHNSRFNTKNPDVLKREKHTKNVNNYNLYICYSELSRPSAN